jgi:carboxypeptidase C (cathepsin A)
MQGFAIGNGLTNPEIQYKAYTDYALEMNLIQKSEYDSINKIYPECQLATKLCGKCCILFITDGYINTSHLFFIFF